MSFRVVATSGFSSAAMDVGTLELTQTPKHAFSASLDFTVVQRVSESVLCCAMPGLTAAGNRCAAASAPFRRQLDRDSGESKSQVTLRVVPTSSGTRTSP